MKSRHTVLLSLLLLAAPAAAPVMAAAPVPTEGYVPKGTCDGWPRAQIGMAKGFCAGLVVNAPADFAQRQLRMPRLILPVAGDTDWIITDMRGWGDDNGMVWKLHAERGKPPQLTMLLSGLASPHGLARGPDGKIYVGEVGRIFRFDPNAASPAATIQTVIANLPKRGLMHPLVHFIFDGDGSFLVNVGSTSDRCMAKGSDGKPDGTNKCNQSEGAEPTAGIRRFAYRGNGVWDANYTIFARGLRNSLALVRHSSGTLLQGENSVDFPEAFSPFEELNVLKAGAHYGWPYCVEMSTQVPTWAGTGAMDCKSARHTPPTRLLPPHGAPLSMMYYNGAMFPELKGKLLLSEHGYRPAGARLVAFTVDARGVPVLTPNARYPYLDTENKPVTSGTRPYPGPASVPMQLTPQWHELKGARPTGTPLGLSVAPDGAIWLVEDKSGTILRIARDKP